MRTLRGFFLMLAMTVLFACGGGGGGGGGGTDPVTPVNPNEPQDPPLTQEESAKKLLYAAYAGIGYNNADPQATAEDDELLFNIMFDDPNLLLGDLMVEKIFMAPSEVCDPNGKPYPKLAALIICYAFPSAGLPVPDMSYSARGVKAVVTLKEKPLVNYVNLSANFKIHMDTDFNTDGYLSKNAVTYKGDASENEFKADIDVTFTLVTNKGPNTTPDPVETPGASYYIQPDVNSLQILTNSALTAEYSAPKRTVQYQEWTISYAANADINPWFLWYILSFSTADPQTLTDYATQLKEIPDNRLYAVKGAYKVGADRYAYDMQYAQRHLDKQDGQKYIFMKGNVGVAGASVAVSSPGADQIPASVFPTSQEISNFITATKILAPGGIRRGLMVNLVDTEGAWSGGTLNSAFNDPVTTTFQLNSSVGDALLRCNSGSSWTVKNWQDTLDPYWIEPK